MMPATQETTELIFIPFPTISHLISSLQVATLLTERDKRLTITFLIMKLPIDANVSSFIQNSSKPRINFIELREDESVIQELKKDGKNFSKELIQSQAGPIRDYVEAQRNDNKKIGGFVIDMFCMGIMEVADELRIPVYVFFTCNSAMLGLVLSIQKFKDDQNKDSLKEYQNSDFEMSVPTYVNPVPAKVWPGSFFVEDGFFDMARRFRKAKGIVVNTFLELESHAIKGLSEDDGGDIPKVYPVGPILHVEREESEENKRKHKEIISWLDHQPDSSVVYLCFGSNGGFEADQVREIAMALENSGHRFLWSLRKPPTKDLFVIAGEYENHGEVLPSGFLERTNGTGKVIGWAPQMAVLSHKAVGGFVSHCGWNSTLESIWCGVPMAVWPLFAEQQVNAFQLVKEFGTAVEIKIDYRRDNNVIVGPEKIENAIKELMDPENEIQVKVKDLKEKSRNVMLEGGSSYNFLGKWIDDVLDDASS